jgi:hypothetical protein
MRARVALAGCIAAVILGGCAAQSASRVTAQSVVVFPRDKNLLSDGGFGQASFGPWQVSVPPPGIASRIDTGSGEALTITIPRTARKGTEFLEQTVGNPPGRVARSDYLLRLRLCMFGVRQPIISQVRFNYADGGYQFVGRATSASAYAGIPRGTTPGCVPVQLNALATRPLASIDVFPVDTGADRPTGGSIMVSDVSLSYWRSPR